MLLADEERSHPVAREEPLVGAGGDEIHPLLPEVGAKHPERLDSVRVQERLVGVREVREVLQIVAKAVLVGDPRDGQEPGLRIHERLEVLPVGASLDRGSDPELDAPFLLERLVEHVARRVMKVVHHHVVPGTEVEGGGHEVLALARGGEKTDLLRSRPEELREFPSRLVRLVEHRAQGDGVLRLGPHEIDSRLLDRPGDGTDVGGVQIGGAGGGGKIRSRRRRIERNARRYPPRLGDSRGSRHDELSSIQPHDFPSFFNDLVMNSARCPAG